MRGFLAALFVFSLLLFPVPEANAGCGLLKKIAHAQPLRKVWRAKKAFKARLFRGAYRGQQYNHYYYRSNGGKYYRSCR